MNCLPDHGPVSIATQERPQPAAVLAPEAGIPFAPPRTERASDPFVEWLDLMEVVQMLCPVWPVRDQPLKGLVWRL